MPNGVCGGEGEDNARFRFPVMGKPAGGLEGVWFNQASMDTDEAAEDLLLGEVWVLKLAELRLMLVGRETSLP